MMKNDFYFNLKSLFVLKIFKFLPSLFGHVEKRLIRKLRLILKLKTSLTGKKNNCNTHIAQYLKNYRQSDNET